MKSDPPAECEEVGSVSASGYKCFGGDEACAKDSMRNDAADMGANYVRYETYNPNSGGSGTAYRCP